MINIGLKPEYIINIFGLEITNSFFTTVLASLFLVVLALTFYSFREERNLFTESFRVLVYELLKLTDNVTKNRDLSQKVLPLIATFFVFIGSSNLLGLVPGFLGSFYLKREGAVLPVLRSPNSDLTTTLALAIFSVGAIQFFSVRVLGLKRYLLRFFNFSNPLAFLVGFFEMLSEGIKILSFSLRLFGNIFAGEIVLLVVGFFVPYLIPLPFMILEVFVGIIQAFIFTMLTLSFIKTSTMRHISLNPKITKSKVETHLFNDISRQ